MIVKLIKFVFFIIDYIIFIFIFLVCSLKQFFYFEIRPFNYSEKGDELRENEASLHNIEEENVNIFGRSEELP